jgi:hypothetical protein
VLTSSLSQMPKGHVIDTSRSVNSMDQLLDNNHTKQHGELMENTVEDIILYIRNSHSIKTKLFADESGDDCGLRNSSSNGTYKLLSNFLYVILA